MLIHENRVARQVMKLGPYLGFPDATFRVTGAGHGTEDEPFTDHGTAEEARNVAETSARQQFGDSDQAAHS